jgi:hypothetical protein
MLQPAGRAETIDAMIRCGFDPNLSDKETAVTPLMVAAEMGDARASAALLRGGADPTLKDVHKRDALCRAREGLDREAAQGYPEVGCDFTATVKVIEIGIQAVSSVRVLAYPGLPGTLANLRMAATPSVTRHGPRLPPALSAAEVPPAEEQPAPARKRGLRP